MQSPPHRSPQLRIRNCRASQQRIQYRITELVQPSRTPVSATQNLLKILQTESLEIEKSCHQQGLTSAHLSDQSRQFLAWIKFLSNSQTLQAHLETIKRLQQCCQDIVKLNRQQMNPQQRKSKPSSTLNPQKLKIELCNQTCLYRYKQTAPDSGLLQVSEVFIAADGQVLDALAKTIVLGKHPKTTAALKRFSTSQDYSEVLLEMDLILEPIESKVQGRNYNLEALFEQVNQQYFQGTLTKPQLAWSQNLTRRKFGHYEPAHNRIVLSLTLDDDRIPAYAAEFVMYHEMLHIRHGATWVNGCRMVHTPAFRQDERQFEHYQLAEAELTRLAQSSSFASEQHA